MSSSSFNAVPGRFGFEGTERTAAPTRHEQILALKLEYGQRIDAASGYERESLVRELARRILELVASRPR